MEDFRIYEISNGSSNLPPTHLFTAVLVMQSCKLSYSVLYEHLVVFLWLLFFRPTEIDAKQKRSTQKPLIISKSQYRHIAQFVSELYFYSTAFFDYFSCLMKRL